MNHAFTVIAALLSVVALYLPARSQKFTRVVVDGRAMRLLVTGTGESTVVFENGLGPSLEMWGKVQPEVSRFARTVSYDRLGVGLSDEGALPRDGRHIAGELQRALRAAGIAPPYILVGASFGGALVRVFAGRYPDDVAGIVLVDPTPDDAEADNPRAAARIPELQSMPDTLNQARDSRVPEGVPVILIDAVSPLEVPFATKSIRELRRQSQAELAAESVGYKEWLDTIPGSRLIVAADTGHNVAIEKPRLVIETIRDLVAVVK